MKKIITLILAFAAFAMGTEKVHASLSGTLHVTIESGMNLEAEENIDANNAFFALYTTQQIYGGL